MSHLSRDIFVALVYHNLVREPVELSEVDPGHQPYHLLESDFHRQMQLIHGLGIQAESISEFLCSMNGDRSSTGQLLLTFDDGDQSNFDLALPILDRYKFTATYFVVPGRMERGRSLRWGQAQELIAAGMEIGSHTMTHPFLPKLSEEELRSEFEQSKKTIEDKLGVSCDHLAIPYGFEHPSCRRIAQECGYRTMSTSRVGVNRNRQVRQTGVFQRIGVLRSYSLETFRRIIEQDRMTLARLVAHDRLKSTAKNLLGLDRWLAFRKFVLAHIP